MRKHRCLNLQKSLAIPRVSRNGGAITQAYYEAAVHLQLACCLRSFLCSGHGASTHALAIAYAVSQYTLCACMHLPIKHRAVLVAPEDAQLPDASECIWLVNFNRISDRQLCSPGIYPAAEVIGIQAC